MESKYSLKTTSQFKKDYKLMKKRHLNIEKLKTVVTMLSNGIPLPPEYKDHELIGNWKNHRECHIQNDWLLIYQIKDNILVLELTRTGNHRELFGR